MFTNILGIRLVLLVGSVVPLPAPYTLSSALTGVEVTNDSEQGDGFQLTFSVGRGIAPEFNLLLTGLLEPFNRVVIGILMGAIPQVLIDGIITHHQLAPGSEPGSSTFTVTGKDLSIMLDLEEKNESYENQPDFIIVTRLIAQYVQYGLVPLPSPTVDVPIMLQRIPRQHETDLKFIQRLAQNNGFVFYIEPVTLGVNTAYWGPENRLGIPQSALSINMGSATNVKSLNFTQDALAPVSSQGSINEPITKLNIPIPSLPSLRVPPLVPFPTQARRKVILRETANESPAKAASAAVASITRSPDPVTGEGELDAARYGSILKARKLVGVRGAGFSYDGFYYVKRVTHTLSKGEYTQKFTLSREGTGAISPVVVP